MDAEIEELYQAIILDHDATPRNYHSLGSATHRATCYNPLCGDSYTVFLEICRDQIVALSFEGHGCAVSKASLSIMTTMLGGATMEEAEQLFRVFRNSLLVDEEINSDRLGELAALTAVRNAPTRIKCAVLGWEAMHEAVSPARSHD